MAQPAAPSVEAVTEFEIALEQTQDFEFRVRFDQPQFDDLMLDEPPPLGRDSAPNAARILAAAVGNCLSASLLFCARKARVPLGAIHTTVKARIARNEKGRLRIAGIEVAIDPGLSAADRPRATRCLDMFEDYCVVTQSVRQGIDVKVRVAGADAPSS